MNIDKLILKLLNRSSSVEEMEVLESWKKESEDNIAVLNLLNVNTSGMDYHDYDPKEAWDKIETQLEGPTVVQKWWKFAAFILIVIASGIFAFYYLNSGSQPIYESSDDLQIFALNDDTKIWLNRNSKLKQLTDFTEMRNVALQGEAFFDVAHNPDVPFIIEINDKDFVKVVGTSFNLINSGNEFDLTVYSGRVELHVLDRIIVLEKNDRIIKSNGAFAKIINRDKNHVSWKSNELIFEDEDLESVFEELEKYYSVDFIYDSTLNFDNCKLRNRYVNQDLSQVLKEFEQLFSLKYKISGNEILIEEVSCF